jgi:plasmid stability protein
MATIVIRKLDETVKRKLKIRAARNGRSMEAEARVMISEFLSERPRNVRRGGLGSALVKRFAPFGGVDLPVPPRTFSKRALPKFDE